MQFADVRRPGETRNVVLVRGGLVDGAGWRGVYDILKRDGCNVPIVQNPTTSPAPIPRWSGSRTKPGWYLVTADEGAAATAEVVN